MRPGVAVDGSYVVQRLARVAAAFSGAALLATTAPGSTATTSPPNWAKKQIATVVAHGLMSTSTRSFHPNAPLSKQTLTDLSSGLEQELGPSDPSPAPPAKA